MGAMDDFASPVGADGKVFLVSQDGTCAVVDAKATWEIGSVSALDDEVLRDAGDCRRPDPIRTKAALYAFAAGAAKGH